MQVSSYGSTPHWTENDRAGTSDSAESERVLAELEVVARRAGAGRLVTAPRASEYWPSSRWLLGERERAEIIK
jgi:hypothetical protein